MLDGVSGTCVIWTWRLGIPINMGARKMAIARTLESIPKPRFGFYDRNLFGRRYFKSQYDGLISSVDNPLGSVTMNMFHPEWISRKYVLSSDARHAVFNPRGPIPATTPALLAEIGFHGFVSRCPRVCKRAVFGPRSPRASGPDRQPAGCFIQTGGFFPAGNLLPSSRLRLQQAAVRSGSGS